MTKSHPATSMQFRSAAESPLGRITQTGFVPHNRGIGFDKMRILGSYALVYVVNGGGRYLDVTGVNLTVSAGDLILFFPELGHAYGPVADQDWTEIYYVFDGPVFDLWRQRGLLDSNRPIRHLEPIDYWLRRFESILGAPRETGYAPPLLEVCRLQTVLAEALVGGMKGTPELAWISQASALLQTDLERVVDLPELARQLGMSYDRFRKRFARTIGMPPAQYRTRCLIDRACELMQRGTLTDKQIADALGFCDEFHFSRRFKQITGKSPRDFRRSLPRFG